MNTYRVCVDVRSQALKACDIKKKSRNVDCQCNLTYFYGGIPINLFHECSKRRVFKNIIEDNNGKNLRNL